MDWNVTVLIDGRHAVTIGPCALSGTEIDREVEQVIREAALRMPTCIGDPEPRRC
jgi:hypothetical protein